MIRRHTTWLSVAATMSLPLVFAAPAGAQSVQTGVDVVVADWLPPWDRETGGWGLVAADAAPEKWVVWSSETTAAVPPGTYDLYWIQDSDHADWPLLMLSDLTVTAGELTEARIEMGAMLDVADWVPPLDGPNAYWGAMPTNDPDVGLINWTFSDHALVLPPGEYDFYWDNDDTDDRPALWIDTFIVEGAFGGVGLSLRQENFRIVVVGAVPGGPAEAAGLVRGDVIVAVDGAPVDNLPLDAAVGLLRGPPETPVVVRVLRPSTGETRDVAITRNRVEPDLLLHVTGGVLPVLDPLLNPKDFTGGRWGAVFAGASPEELVAWHDGDLTTPMLLGWDYYDIYWSPREGEPFRLVAENVDVRGGLLEVPFGPEHVAPPTR